MSENKTSKYFKYAIGEIILVVIGILIALQINNWNEDKKSRVQEIKYLKNLKKDIEVELINNDSIIGYRILTAKAASKMLYFKTLKSAKDLLTLEHTIQQVFERRTFIPTNNTYKELLSSGNLNFILNDSIKDFLLELDKMYVAIGNTEYHMYREYEEYLYNVSINSSEMLNLFDIKKSAEKGEFVYINPVDISNKSLIVQYNNLLKKKEFKNGLKLSVMNNIAIKNMHKDMTHHLKKLIKLIQDDIDKG